MMQVEVRVTDRESGGFPVIGTLVIHNVTEGITKDTKLHDYDVALHVGSETHHAHVHEFRRVRGPYALLAEALFAVTGSAAGNDETAEVERLQRTMREEALLRYVLHAKPSKVAHWIGQRIVRWVRL